MNKTVLEQPRIDEMYANGWKLYGICPTWRAIKDQDLLPPWIHWFYCPYTKGYVECWIKD